ncbi:hypothetical protein EYF80_041129 [Liparis tanakae]|uniref:Uncharacterized protein n=1 Tax=Liparis tanakae TaxID=230148 RepID=A0A4Z2G7V3_9TELE|nr:hypothetical protein EYF80_041129 [Liparis tanakae]
MWQQLPRRSSRKKRGGHGLRAVRVPDPVSGIFCRPIAAAGPSRRSGDPSGPARTPRFIRREKGPTESAYFPSLVSGFTVRRPGALPLRRRRSPRLDINQASARRARST